MDLQDEARRRMKSWKGVVWLAATWIQRYLLSPQAPVALKELAVAESGAKGLQ
jgi:hypothetical protein